jgi:CBS domain-containing protein/uncharacterized protein (DUF2267 family)
MSLARYTQGRLVVLRADTNAYDAARAMDDNHIGAVMVHDGEGLVGLVTDRDLAMHVVGGDRDPFEVELRDLVSTPSITISVSASEFDAARLMLNHHLRRLPIVDGADLVGLVTLDDLILEQAVDMATCAAILQAQLSDPAKLKRRGDVGPSTPPDGTDAARGRRAQRHRANARRSLDYLIQDVLTETRLPNVERATAALEEVVSGIARRISPEEACQFLAQLPSLLAERIEPELEEADRGITRSRIERAVAARLSLDLERAAEIVRQVSWVLARNISAGELDDVRGQLPPDLKELFGSFGRTS